MKQEESTNDTNVASLDQNGTLLYKILEITNKSIEVQSEMLTGIKGLQTALAGSEDGSLLSQIKLLRQDSIDQFGKLNNSFKQFSDHMVENNQKSFIEALRAAMVEYL